MQKKFIIANKLTIKETPTTHLAGAPREINNLICYLYCFLDSGVYSDNKPQSTKVIRKMLMNAHLSNSILSFSFPRKIRLQFCLQKKYRINIRDKNTAFNFFIGDLLPKNKLACSINVEAIGAEQRLAVRRIQKIILDSKEHLRSVSIRKQTNGYITILKFRLKSIPRKKLHIQKKLTLAIYTLQEELSPE